MCEYIIERALHAGLHIVVQVSCVQHMAHELLRMDCACEKQKVFLRNSLREIHKLKMF